MKLEENLVLWFVEYNVELVSYWRWMLLAGNLVKKRVDTRLFHYFDSRSKFVNFDTILIVTQQPTIPPTINRTDGHARRAKYFDECLFAEVIAYHAFHPNLNITRCSSLKKLTVGPLSMQPQKSQKYGCTPTWSAVVWIFNRVPAPSA